LVVSSSVLVVAVATSGGVVDFIVEYWGVGVGCYCCCFCDIIVELFSTATTEAVGDANEEEAKSDYARY